MKGYIVFNGNIQFEADFIDKFRNLILSSHHSDPIVKDSKKVLLITAAWQKREFQESHVKQALYNIGLQPKFKDGFDQNIQNLSVYHDFNIFKKEEDKLHAFYHSKQKLIQKVKEFYREKNSGLISIFQKQIKNLKKTFRQLTLHQILSYNPKKNNENFTDYNQFQLLYHYACLDIQNTMTQIKENDSLMTNVCKEIDDYFFINSNISKNETYIALR
ncbi:MAG: hypothetical protein AABZ74_03455 [Cyanobacteriota bacterium]